MNNSESISIIDLFAGPGGLGEGFSSLIKNKQRAFSIGLSIEKDQFAHKTLLLRSFTRQFQIDKIPKDYYTALAAHSIEAREELLSNLFQKYESEFKHASNEAWLATLGSEEFPSKMVDSRIVKALNGHKNWLLIGGPPCQAYSLVGRSRNQGIFKDDHRVYLYKEYLRIIARHQPAVFVMENVKGLLSARIDGESVFSNIRKDLQNPSRVFPSHKSSKYKIYSFVNEPSSYDAKGFPIYDDKRKFTIRAEEYGVPQKRHRVILLGIRADLPFNENLNILKKLPETTVESAISDLPKLRSGISRKLVSEEFLPNGKRKRIYEKINDNDKIWKSILARLSKEVFSLNGFREKGVKFKSLDFKHGTGGEYIECSITGNKSQLKGWYFDKKLSGVNNHQSRSHLYQDVKRYLFATIYSRAYKKFPRMIDYKKHSDDLLPDHKNALSGKFSDRFRVQLSDSSATTVTSHISKDGHYFIHYDQNQCRSFTVREAARIQTFPDNYLFRGPRTAQFHQVGNAVPPYLALQLAEIVFDIFKGF